MDATHLGGGLLRFTDTDTNKIITIPATAIACTKTLGHDQIGVNGGITVHVPGVAQPLATVRGMGSSIAVSEVFADVWAAALRGDLAPVPVETKDARGPRKFR